MSERARESAYLSLSLSPAGAAFTILPGAVATGALNTGGLTLSPVPARFLYVVRRISCRPLHFGKNYRARYRAKIKDVGADRTSSATLVSRATVQSPFLPPSDRSSQFARLRAFA